MALWRQKTSEWRRLRTKIRERIGMFFMLLPVHVSAGNQLQGTRIRFWLFLPHLTYFLHNYLINNRPSTWFLLGFVAHGLSSRHFLFFTKQLVSFSSPLTATFPETDVIAGKKYQLQKYVHVLLKLCFGPSHSNHFSCRSCRDCRLTVAMTTQVCGKESFLSHCNVFYAKVKHERVLQIDSVHRLHQG